MMIMGWAERKFLFPLKKIILAGISIEKLAVSLTIGLIVGLIPIYGITTLLVGGIAIALRLNFIAVQIAHYIVHPVQIALLVPFLKIGDSLLLKSDSSFTVKQYIGLFKADFWGAMHDLWLINLSAIGVWLILSIPLSILVYYCLFRVIKRFIPRLSGLRR